jgi:hypothetical protein
MGRTPHAESYPKADGLASLALLLPHGPVGIKLKLPRRRWFVLVGCLAAVVCGFALLSFEEDRRYQRILASQPLGGEHRFTREQYVRIRLGMTPGEVFRAVYPSGPPKPRKYDRGGLGFVPREQVAVENDGLLLSCETYDTFLDDYVTINVGYRGGKAVAKDMAIYVPPSKAQEWLHWLRWDVRW